jgi:hypothetical protein
VQIEDNGKLGEPINIGAPFNTQEDDMGFVASADGRSAFFIRNLDIYFADISALTEKIKPIDPAPNKDKELTTPSLRCEPRPTPITLYFDHNRDRPSRQELEKLKEVSPSIFLHIHGYCDSDGSLSYNFDLAKRRCENIKETLVLMGIPAENLEMHIHGETMPAASNQTEEGKALNRKVEVRMD